MQYNENIIVVVQIALKDYQTTPSGTKLLEQQSVRFQLQKSEFFCLDFIVALQIEPHPSAFE